MVLALINLHTFCTHSSRLLGSHKQPVKGYKQRASQPASRLARTRCPAAFILLFLLFFCFHSPALCERECVRSKIELTTKIEFASRDSNSNKPKGGSRPKMAARVCAARAQHTPTHTRTSELCRTVLLALKSSELRAQKYQPDGD